MNDAMYLRQLTHHDLPALQALLEADPGYAHRVTGTDPDPAEAVALLRGAPPDLPAERKLVLGAFDDNGLGAVIDVLRGWPNSSTAHIGLLQVHAGRKRQGIGRRAHALLLEMVEGWPEIASLRAAIVATNAATADPFWATLGYEATEPPQPYGAGRLQTQVTAWTRQLPRPRQLTHPTPDSPRTGLR